MPKYHDHSKTTKTKIPLKQTINLKEIKHCLTKGLIRISRMMVQDPVIDLY
jgi:hypothetical protein